MISARDLPLGDLILFGPCPVVVGIKESKHLKFSLVSKTAQSMIMGATSTWVSDDSINFLWVQIWLNCMGILDCLTNESELWYH